MHINTHFIRFRLPRECLRLHGRHIQSERWIHVKCLLQLRSRDLLPCRGLKLHELPQWEVFVVLWVFRVHFVLSGVLCLIIWLHSLLSVPHWLILLYQWRILVHCLRVWANYHNYWLYLQYCLQSFYVFLCLYLPVWVL